MEDIILWGVRYCASAIYDDDSEPIEWVWIPVNIGRYSDRDLSILTDVEIHLEIRREAQLTSQIPF